MRSVVVRVELVRRSVQSVQLLVVGLDDHVGALAEAWFFLEGAANLLHVDLALSNLVLAKNKLVHAVAAENDHLVVLSEAVATHWLCAHKLLVLNLELLPVLAGNRRAISRCFLIRLNEFRRSSCIQCFNQERRTSNSARILTRHHIDETLVQHDSCTVSPCRIELLAIEPTVNHGIVGCHDATRLIASYHTTDGQDPPVFNQGKGYTAPGSLHLRLFNNVQVSINHAVVRQQDIVPWVISCRDTTNHVNRVI